MNRARLVMSHVTKVYGVPGEGASVHALGPIDFELRTGEFFSIVGPSGCGKSTLLEIVAGLTDVSEGKLEFGGVDQGAGSGRSIGVVFQEDASFPWLTVRDNIAFGLKRHRVDRRVAEERTENALALMGLKDFARSYPGQLSGGMRQRVCIARTLVLEPSLILLDEPFGALDQQTRLLMGDELLKLWRVTGATVLLITHSLDEAAMLSDRIGIMSCRPGRFLEIIETGWPQERDSRIAESDEFGKITGHLWSILREESIKSMGRGGRSA